MADTITNDMRSMAQSYSRGRSSAQLIQHSSSDEGWNSRRSVRNASEVSNNRIGSNAHASASAANDSTYDARTAARRARNTQTIAQSNQENQRDQRHAQVMQGQKEQTRVMRSVQSDVSSIHGMLYNQMYGPDVSPYSRDTGDQTSSVDQLGPQLAEQHRELMLELQQIRYAVENMSDMGGGFFGGGRNGGAGGGSGRSRKPGKAGAAGKAGGWFQRFRSSISGAGSGRAKLIGAGVLGAVGVGSLISQFNPFSGGNVDDIRRQMSSTNRSTPNDYTPQRQSISQRVRSGMDEYQGSHDKRRWTGLGSISQSNESTRGVHEISSGRGDHGGVSYGAHQLSSNTGGMAKFLRSEQGSQFAPMFRGLQPGTDAFNARYAQVAQDHEKSFGQAQSNYITSSHFDPMVEKVRQGSGFDVRTRGPAVQEMVYSTAVQYGSSSSVINRALRGMDPNSMSDSEIVRAVQDYKRDTVGSYFRSSSANVQESVRRRASREKGQLLSLNTQYENGELDMRPKPSANDESYPQTEVAQSQQMGQPQASDAGLDSSSVAAATVAGAGTLGAGALALSARERNNIDARTANARSAGATSAANDEQPSSRRERRQARQQRARAAQMRGKSGASNARTAAGKTSRVRLGGKLARGIPGVNALFAGYDAATILSDDEMSEEDKKWGLAGVGGGWGGAAAGGAAGAAVGSVVPVVGTAIGGIVGGTAGYFAGKSTVSAARQAFDSPDDAQPEYLSQDALSAASRVTESSPNSLIQESTRAAANASKQEITQELGKSDITSGTMTAAQAVSRSAANDSSVPSDSAVGGQGGMTGTMQSAAMSMLGAITGIDASQGPTGYGMGGRTGQDLGYTRSAISRMPESTSSASTSTSASHPTTREGRTTTHDYTKTAPTPTKSKTSRDALNVQNSDISYMPQMQRSQSSVSSRTGSSNVLQTSLSSSIGSVSQSTGTANTTGRSFSGPTSRTVSDVPRARSSHDSVQKVAMIEPQNKTTSSHERQKLGKEGRSPDTSSTYESRNVQPNIDDTPALVADFGLTFLNTGFI